MLRLILLGFGSVNQDLCRIINDKQIELQNLLNGKQILIVGVSDSKGAIFDPNGIQISSLLSIKKSKSSIIYYKRNTKLYENSLSMLQDIDVIPNYDILIDGSPANLEHGNPGMECGLQALESGKKVVTANKAPLVLNFSIFHQPKYANRLRYSATICGGLPVVNVLMRDTLPQISTVTEIAGIFNSTSNYILSQLTININDEAWTVERALKDAQNIGITEADPTLDINGSDTASKLCIIMNIIGIQVQFSDIERSGLELIDKEYISSAMKERGNVVKMVARATRLKKENSNAIGWKLSVKCEEIDPLSFMGSTNLTETSIEIESDLFSRQCFKSNDPDVVGTSSAVLRDIISLDLNNSRPICKL